MIFCVNKSLKNKLDLLHNFVVFTDIPDNRKTFVALNLLKTIFWSKAY
jgi:hypothetical protein